MTSPLRSEAEFLLNRAEEEAILAIRTGEGAAEQAHQELSRLYSARAQKALAVAMAAEALEA